MSNIKSICKLLCSFKSQSPYLWLLGSFRL